MNKSCSLLIYLSLLLFAYSGKLSAQYCIPDSINGTAGGYFIEGVQINNFDNYGTGSSGGPFYNDYTALPAILLDTIGNNDLVITSGDFSGNMYYHAWIDYNQDADFDDVDEYLGQASSFGAYNLGVISFSFPAGALKGSSRLRVAIAYNQATLGPCDIVEWGEVEDYSAITPGINDVGIALIASGTEVGDYDNDGDLDMLAFVDGVTQVYRNDGDNIFTKYDWHTTLGGPHSMIDYDNDGDLDIAITGTFAGIPTARIYRNDKSDGVDWFTDIEAGLTGLTQASLDWGDYNNDGRPDLLITGLSVEDEQLAILYRNEGLDVFTNSGIDITAGVEGDIEWGDIDNDEYPDLLIMGTDYNGNIISDVYRNDTEGNFIRLYTGIDTRFRGEVAFGDYNRDGYLDFAMCGQHYKADIYKNNKDLTFTKITTSFPALGYATLAWGDYDNDGDLDLLQTGERYTVKQTHLYRNDGNDLFTEVAHGLRDIAYGVVTWADYDNDYDLDLIISGSYTDGSYTRIFRNDILVENLPPTEPTNLFSIVINDGAQLAWIGGFDSEVFPDLNTLSYDLKIGTTPGGIDVLAPLSNVSGTRLKPGNGNSGMNELGYIGGLSPGTYYWSVQTMDQNFTTSAFSAEDSFKILETVEPVSNPAPDVSRGGVDWGDYNKDGFQDILICGRSPFIWDGNFTKILKNNGDYTFDTITAGLTGIQFGDVAWGDYDNDNDLDILLSGATGELKDNEITKIYRNDGGDLFTDIGAAIPGNYDCEVEWADIDNDGDLDALIAGYIESEIYRNIGGDQFVDMNVGLPKISGITICLGDFDNDFDLDIVIGKYSQTSLYINDGKGNFSSTASPLPWIAGTIEAGDFDADGDLDLFFAGSNETGNSALIYSNEGNGVFTDIDAGLRGVGEAMGIWGDFDNDYYPDILYTGKSGSYITKLLLNEKNGSFYDTKIDVLANYEGSVSTADIDNDNDLDIYVTTGNDLSVVYRNNMNFPEFNLPGPQNLSSENVGKGIVLSWDEPEDMPLKGSFTYNIRIGSSSMGTDVVSPMTISPSSKKRLLPEMGNAQNNMGWKIDSLPVGDYFWSVQVITPAYNGGDWAVESSFTITALSPYFSSDIACLGEPTSFTDETIITGTEIASWLWDFGDGSTSTTQHPDHTYATPGNFTAVLTVTDTSGVSLSKTNPVLVLPKPTASFGISDVCIGSLASTVNNSITDTLVISSWAWDYGDGSTSALKAPGPYGYLLSGSYDIELRVDAMNGCYDSVIHQVQVAEYPVASISAGGNPEFCEGGEVKLSVPQNIYYDYQWKIGGALIPGADSSVYDASSTGDYKVSVTNQVAGCNSESLSPVSVLVFPTPAQPLIQAGSSTTFCQGDSVILTAQYFAGYTYQWKLNGGGVGGNSNTYIAKTGGIYSLDITNSSGCPNTSSNTVSVFVYTNPDKPTVALSGETTFCSDKSLTLSVTSEAGMSYQWTRDGSLISGATSVTYNPYLTGEYILGVTNIGTGCNSESLPTSVTVNPTPDSPTIGLSGDSEFCEGGSVTLSAADDVDLTYLWKKDGGAVGADQNTHIVTTSGIYTLEVSNTYSCVAAAGNTATVTVNSNPTIPTVNVGGATIFCDGGSVNLSVTNDGTMEYQWYNGAVTVGGAITSSFDAVATGVYKLIINNTSGCVSETVPTSVTVNPSPDLPTIGLSGDNEFCEGDSVLLSAADDINLTYLWKKDGGAVGTDLNEYTATQAGDYSLEVGYITGCNSTSVNTPTITVNSNPLAPSVNISGATTICDVETLTLDVSNDGTMTYQWYDGVDIIGGATSNSIDPLESGNYKLSIKNASGCVSETSPVAVTVYPTPASPTINLSGLATFCEGGSVTLSVSDDPALTYHWKKDGGATGSDQNTHIVTSSGDYTLEVSNASGCTATSSNTVTVTVYDNPITPTVGINGDTTFCEGQSVELSVTNNPLMTYQWMDGELNVGGAITSSYTATATGFYKLKVTSGDDCSVETKAVNVIADPAPTAPTIGYTGALEFCDTESLVLSVADNPNYTYEWQFNGGFVGTNSSSYTANATGAYTVKVQNLGDCSVMSVNTVSLTVHPTPSSPTLNLSGVTTFCEGGDVTLSVADPGADSYQWISELGEIGGEISTSLTIEETGLYKIRVRNTGMCKSFSQEIAVTVYAYPTTPVILTENYEENGCQDDDLVILSLQASEENISYTWSKDGNLIEDATSDSYSGYLDEGSYKVKADNNGCIVESQPQTVIYAEMPDKPEIIAEGPTVWYLACSNDSATAYKWYLNGLEIEGAVDYLYVAETQLGKYEVAISVNGSCFAKSDPQWIPLGTGIDVDPWENLKIYPNPTPGIFTLEMDNHIMGELIIDIFGESGTQIINIKFQKETAHFKTQIDLSAQPAAAYLIGMMLDKYRTNRTLIVE